MMALMDGSGYFNADGKTVLATRIFCSGCRTASLATVDCINGSPD
jgi:hypothetical protein